MNDNGPVARQTHVKLNAVCPERKAVIKRGERIFRRQQGATPVSEDERPGRGEEGMLHNSARV
jgi:hypothetical protein